MLKILNLDEARNWSNENLYEADSYLSPLSVAVKKGLLMEIDKEHFAIVETEYNGCKYRLEKIWKLTDEEMQEHNLWCRYRYKEVITKHPTDYIGWMEHEAGFNL